MDFAFGAARALYQRHAHPRLLASARDLEHLRAGVKHGHPRAIMRALRTRVSWITDQVLNAPDLPGLLAWKSRSWSDPGILIRMALDDIGFVAALDEDARALEALHRVFGTLVQDLAGQHRTNLCGTQAALAYDWIYSQLSSAERNAFAAAAVDVIQRTLKKTRGNLYRSAAGNLTIMECFNSIPLLLAVQGERGVPSLDKEQAELVRRLEASLHTAIGPDGYPAEDIGYGTAVAASLSLWAEMLRRAGRFDPYAQSPHYALFGQAILHFVQPWGGFLSNTGDHGDDFRHREFILARLAQEKRDPSLLWLLGTLSYHHGTVNPGNRLPSYYVEVPLATNLRVPASALSLLTEPDLRKARNPAVANVPTAFRDRGRGIVSFRSGWRADDTLVVFDASQRSPAAPGHAHDSAGHFSLSALGEYFAIDTGRYNIEQNCHNVTLIDGRSGRSTDGQWRMSYYHGLLTDFIPGRFCDFAAVDSSHQHNCYWARRSLGLVKGSHAPAYAWVVDDINKHNDWSEYWWQLHSSPENRIRLHGRSATITGCRQGNALDVHFVLPQAVGGERPYRLRLAQDIAKPSSFRYVPHPFADARAFARPSDMVHGPVHVRPRLLAKVTGWNGRFMSLLLPRFQGDPPAQVRILRGLPNTLAVRIRFAAVEDVVIFAFDHNLLEADDIVGRGRWCVVRRARRTGRAIDFQIGDGTQLRAGHRVLA